MASSTDTAVRQSPRRKAPVQMQPGGATDGYVGTQANQRAIFDKCAEWLASEVDLPEADQELARPFEEQTIHSLTDKRIWQYFATYIVEEYKISKPGPRYGKPLLVTSATDLWIGMLHQVNTCLIMTLHSTLSHSLTTP